MAPEQLGQARAGRMLMQDGDYLLRRKSRSLVDPPGSLNGEPNRVDCLAQSGGDRGGPSRSISDSRHFRPCLERQRYRRLQFAQGAVLRIVR